MSIQDPHLFDSSRLSFGVSGAVLAQIGSYCKETIDWMDRFPPYLCTGWT